MCIVYGLKILLLHNRNKPQLDRKKIPRTVDHKWQYIFLLI